MKNQVYGRGMAIAVAAIATLALLSCVSPTDTGQSGENHILTFTINGRDAGINHDTGRVTVVLPAETDVSSLAPTIAVSDKATVSPGSGAARNFTEPVSYTVTAENGDTRIYTAAAALLPADLDTALSEAAGAKSGIVTAPAAEEAPEGAEWVPQEALEDLNEAIAKAESVATKPGATEEEKADALEELAKAVEDFENAKQTGAKTETEAVNKSALTGAIAAANAAKAGIAVDTAAANVPVGTYWVTQAEWDALNTAIRAAEAVAANAGATQAETDAAAGPLTAAASAFAGAKKAGTRPVAGTTDKTALNAAIIAANAAKTAVVVNTAAANVPVGTYWVTQAEWNALNTAITAAETIAEKTNATQTEANGAEAALTAATTAFNGAKKAGTKTETPAETDKTSLNSAITAAAAAKLGVDVDTDAANVPEGSSWVTQAEMDALNVAIGAAETVAEKADATQAEADGAEAALAAAVTAFNAAKKAGTKPETPEEADKTALNEAITAANAAKLGVAVDTAAGNVPVGTSWVTQAVMDALNAAIDAAEIVAENAGAAQAEADGTAAALTTAVTAFTAAKRDGTKQPPAENKTALTGALTAAANAKKDVAVDTAAGNVPVGTSWVVQADITALNTAITAAETVSANVDATQAQVDGAAAALTAAVTTFNAAKKAGTFVAVTGIAFTVPTNGTRGYAVSLAGATAQPATASYTTIVWTLKTAADGTIAGNIFTPSVTGEVTLVATIANGTAIGTAYSREFKITIKAPGTLDPTVGLGDYPSITLKDGTGAPLPYDEPVYVELGAEYSVHIDGSDYTGIAWFLNGERQTVTGSLIYLDTNTAGTIKLTVEGKRKDTPESSEIYTFIIKN
ncbi:MAG: hypothetical protein LBG14_01760 [Treponema sp.]|jgi:hypothetical protein|nr:hypothetical protein [Treponema sp.]